MGGAAFRAALANPRDARLRITLDRQLARYLRFQVEQTTSAYPWAVADVVVESAVSVAAD